MRAPIVVTAGLLLVHAALAAAQHSPGVSALRAHDSELPIDITADRLQVLQRQSQAVFEGNVTVIQGDLTLTADRIIVHYRGVEEAADPEIDRLDAQGRVEFRSPSESATGDWGLYDVERRLLRLGGAVELAQGTSQLLGERLDLNLETGLISLRGAADDSGQGRVSGRFSAPARDRGQDNEPDE